MTIWPQVFYSLIFRISMKQKVDFELDMMSLPALCSHFFPFLLLSQNSNIQSLEMCWMYEKIFFYRRGYSYGKRFWICLRDGISCQTSWRVFVQTTQRPCGIVPSKRIDIGFQVSTQKDFFYSMANSHTTISNWVMTWTFGKPFSSLVAIGIIPNSFEKSYFADAMECF